ncbi:hypothetical protein BGZ68_004295 [Mortierella alpina]|nr:hypothetical protein BGZ68_004295 [Mortierella alpina]
MMQTCLSLPRLSEIYCDFSVPAMASDGGRVACNFIRGALGLETVRGGNTWNIVLPCDPSNVIRALVTYQFSTLQEIEFLNCESIGSADQQAILSSCRQLKRLWMVPRTTLKPQEGLQFQDVLDGEWVCLGLRELYLILDRTIKVKALSQAMRLESLALTGETATKDTGHEELHTGERSGRETMAWAAKRVYSQLGRLADLKILSIGFVMTDQERRKATGYSFQWDLTLSRGWLAELSGLKNLRHLHLRTDFWTRMGQAEVEFMDAKWPLLESVTFIIFRWYSAETDLFLKLMQKPHWLWLQKRRPQLALIFGKGN